MSFPYDFDEDFEDGTIGTWDAETDTQGILDIVHYTNLCKTPPYQPPYRGAYCAKIDLAGHTGTTTATLQHNALDMSADVTRFIRWYMFVDNLVMAASDRFQIFSIRATDTEHVIVEIFNNAGTIQLRAGQNSTGGTLRSTDLIQGVWHCIELGLAYDGAGDAGGTIDFYVDGYQVGAQITTLTQAASTRFNLGTFVGATSVNTGITSGIILFDQVILDGIAGTAGTRIGTMPERFPANRILTKSGHVAVGPGHIEDVLILDGGSVDTSINLYDTDRAETFLADPIVLQHNGTSGSRFEEPSNSLGKFKRGVYAVLAGTNPRASVALRHGNNNLATVRNHATSII